MYDFVCITNRSLCKDDYFERIKRIAFSKPSAIILREKDLSENEYILLAQKVIEICENNTRLILHNYVNAAVKLNFKSIHLPMHVLKQLNEGQRGYFTILGASCHSVKDAVEAQSLGCTYITASNIYETDCKKGLKGKGLAFLSEVCEAVSIPVYALGGITPENYHDVIKAGAKGACVMSGIMTVDNPNKYIIKFGAKNEI